MRDEWRQPRIPNLLFYIYLKERQMNDKSRIVSSTIEVYSKRKEGVYKKHKSTSAIRTLTNHKRRCIFKLAVKSVLS